MEGSNSSLSKYKGRFAPSPTGPLHFGSLVAAVASYLQAKHQQGNWHIRIDDLDHYRCQSSYADQILFTLERIGLEWDGAIIYQSKRLDIYQQALNTLEDHKQLYSCACSRKQLQTGRYPNTCRSKHLKIDQHYSLRVKTINKQIEFHDQIQGLFTQNIYKEIGDFIIRRRDNVIAYHLATVIDDADAGFTEIVRGSDLLDSTPRQIYLQQLLKLTTPNYYHIPIAVNSAGEKLSKQTYAEPIFTEKQNSRAMQTLLYKSLRFLNQSCPKELLASNTNEILNYAIEHWQTKNVPKQFAIEFHDSVN